VFDQSKARAVQASTPGERCLREGMLTALGADERAEALRPAVMPLVCKVVVS
jgi:hypothetical protein